MKVVKTKSGKVVKVWLAGQRPHILMAVNGAFASSGVPMTLMEAMQVRTEIDRAIVELSDRVRRAPPPPTEPKDAG